ncbi:MAG: YhdT family protein [Firmicutes bacterium]|nr:YhdT family protein [Bacillota bacterium]
MEKMTYKEKFIQMNKEAKATWIVAGIIIVYWFASGFGVYELMPEATIFSMPAWFVLSCFGSWILSIVLVIFLVKKVFKNFDLDDEEEEM